ncbi:hypothetical protein J6590_004628 [Homalodisca vitripennis]|nr:hypothetical protein J6590_004628 [Homalodisca vitripennis]
MDYNNYDNRGHTLQLLHHPFIYPTVWHELLVSSLILHGDSLLTPAHFVKSARESSMLTNDLPHSIKYAKLCDAGELAPGPRHLLPPRMG